MATELFDAVAEQLELATSLSRLEARGTLRIVLKVAGLDASSTNTEHMAVALSKVLPSELENRGISQCQETCESLAGYARGAAATLTNGDSPEDIFRRLGS